MPIQKRSKTSGTKKSSLAPSGKSTKKNEGKAMAISAPFKKSELFGHLAQATELSKSQIVLLFEELAEVIRRHLGKGGVEQFTFPGLMKITVKQKPATKKRKGTNPFTGEPIVFKAKPARNVLKVRALKRLKQMVD